MAEEFEVVACMMKTHFMEESNPEKYYGSMKSTDEIESQKRWHRARVPWVQSLMYVGCSSRARFQLYLALNQRMDMSSRTSEGSEFDTRKNNVPRPNGR